MRRLSVWARQHTGAARAGIIISHVLLIVIGVFLANAASALVWISPIILYFLLAVLFILFIVYPKKTSRDNYARRKLLDFSAGGISFLILVVTAMQLNSVHTASSPSYAALPATDTAFKNSEVKMLLQQFESGEKTKFSRKEKRILKNEFNFQLLLYAKARVGGNKPAADQSWLIILAIIGAVGLLFLVGAWACSLSCNGAEGAAIAVAVLGTAGIIFGLIAVIRSIKRKGQVPA